MATSPNLCHRPPIQVGGIRRSFTQPPRSLSFHERAGLDPSDSDEHILYSHPRAQIISFTPPTNAVQSKSSPVSIDLDYPVDTIETLPWASSTEDLLASGALSIEKVRGSTNFLKSGSKPLHALMRNSQCWCVDGEATLVMRVGAFKYYRIELPYTTEEDKEKVQVLKDVLKRILRFEATPCPFKRGFHIDLPESATTPRKKGPWKRRPGSLLSSPVSTTPSPLNLKKSRARAASEDIGMQRGEVAFMDIKAEEHDDSSNEDAADNADMDARVDAIAEDDDAVARTDVALDGSRAMPGSSSNATLAAEETRDYSSLALEISAIEDPSIASSEGEAGAKAQADLEVSPYSEESDTGKSPSAPSDKTSITNSDLKSVGHTVTAPNEQLDGAADTSSMVESTTDGPDHSSASSNNITNHLEHLTTEDSTESAKQSNGLIEEVHHEVVMDSAETAEANGVGEIELNFLEQPSNSAETAEAMNNSAAQSPDDFAVEETPLAQSSEDSVEDFAPPRWSLPSRPQALDTVSVSSRADSFHSFDSSESSSSEVENTPTACSDRTSLAEAPDPLIMSPQYRSEDISGRAVTADNAALGRSLSVSSLRPPTAISEGPSTPSLVRSSASDSSWPEVETPAATSAYDGLRQRRKKKRSFSPLPPSSTLFVSPPQSPRGTHITGAILQRVRNLALAKPIEILATLFGMVGVIARATPSDLYNGNLWRLLAERGADYHRNPNLPDQADPRMGEASEEDDFGVPLRGRSRSTGLTSRKDDDTDSLFDLD